jgi:hypothetical protein
VIEAASEQPSAERKEVLHRVIRGIIAEKIQLKIKKVTTKKKKTKPHQKPRRSSRKRSSGDDDFVPNEFEEDPPEHSDPPPIDTREHPMYKFVIDGVKSTKLVKQRTIKEYARKGKIKFNDQVIILNPTRPIQTVSLISACMQVYTKSWGEWKFAQDVEFITLKQPVSSPSPKKRIKNGEDIR